MRLSLLIGLLCISSLTQANGVQIGCKRLQLLLDPELSPKILEYKWASGESVSQIPAVLELRGCKGELLDQLILDAPLARLDPTLLRGASTPTCLVSVDLTAAAGSYNGPLTFPVQVVNHHLQIAEAIASDGHHEPIYLAMTGKAAWKKFVTQTADDLLSVKSEPDGNSFVTFYRRYHPTRNGWLVRVKSVPVLWESDGQFPEINFFP